MHTTTFGDVTYSIDMMIAYINTHADEMRERTFTVKLSTFTRALSFKGWENDRGRTYSPQQVLDNPRKYIGEYERIVAADLAYPIIVVALDDRGNRQLVDGMHRICKALLENRTEITAYLIDSVLLERFRIGEYADDVDPRLTPLHSIIEMAVERFQ